MFEISSERQRQVSEEGWTESHDDGHVNGEMAAAAACYASHPWADVPDSWPWEGAWWKPKSYRGNLIRAAALIVAELERLERAEK